MISVVSSSTLSTGHRRLPVPLLQKRSLLQLVVSWLRPQDAWAPALSLHRRNRGTTTWSAITSSAAAAGSANAAPATPKSSAPARTARRATSGWTSRRSPSTKGAIRSPLRFWMTTDVITVITRGTHPTRAAIVKSGSRASQGPMRGISSPSATTSPRSNGEGTPSGHRASAVAPPTIPITVSFAPM